MKVGDLVRTKPATECAEWLGYVLEVHDKHELVKVCWFGGSGDTYVNTNCFWESGQLEVISASR